MLHNKAPLIYFKTLVDMAHLLADFAVMELATIRNIHYHSGRPSALVAL